MYPYRRQPNNPYDKTRKNRQNANSVKAENIDFGAGSFQGTKKIIPPAPSIFEFTGQDTQKSNAAHKFGIVKQSLEEDNLDNSNDKVFPINPPETFPDNLEPADDVNVYIIQMLIESIKDETADSQFYDELSNMLDNDDDVKVFHKMICDEKKHMKIFTEIYEILTGSEPSDEDMKTDKKPVSEDMTKNFSDSLFNELAAVEFYRKLYFVFLNTELRDALFEIITDEQAHAQILNYMYSKYSR